MTAFRRRIGNDVMDLRHPRCVNRTSGDRLLDRILDPAERSWLGDSVGTDLWTVHLWALWAAKEVAFKLFCKLSGSRPFVPRAFRCELSTTVPPGVGVVRIEGAVHHAEALHPVRVEGSSNHSCLHVVGWNGSRGQLRSGRIEVGVEAVDRRASVPLEHLQDHFTPAEWEDVRSLHSAWVRILARDRIRSHLAADGSGPPRGRGTGSVEIRSSGSRPLRSAPEVWFEGRELTGFDLSLSHHGRYVAWALLVP